MGLSNHCGTKRATELEVRAVPEPEWTDTWHPTSHSMLIDAMGEAVQEVGLKVVSREYSLNTTGMRLFGTWGLSGGDGRYGWELGFRQGLDMSMMVGMCGGTRTFVCDNMCFDGNFITFRKHTGGLDYEELVFLAGQAVVGLFTRMRELKAKYTMYRQQHVSADSFKPLVYDLMTGGVFAPSKFNPYLSCLDEEIKINHGGRSLYAVHAAGTRLMREDNLISIADRSAKLTQVCDAYYKQLAA